MCGTLCGSSGDRRSAVLFGRSFSNAAVEEPCLKNAREVGMYREQFFVAAKCFY